jgi:hypothetical protein
MVYQVKYNITDIFETLWILPWLIYVSTVWAKDAHING